MRCGNSFAIASKDGLNIPKEIHLTSQYYRPVATGAVRAAIGVGGSNR